MRAAGRLRALAGDRGGDELVATQDVDGGGVGAEQGGRLAGELLEDGGRVQLGGEQAARAGELLRERARRALALEELAPLEGAAGGTAEVLRQDEIVVGELAHLAEHHEHAAPVVAARQLERRDEQRAVAGRARRLAERGREALVLEQLRRRQHAAGADGVDEGGHAAQLALERLGLGLAELVAAGQLEAVGSRHEHGAEGGGECLAGRVGERAEGGRGRDGLAEQRRDAVEAPLDPRLALAALVGLGVRQREGGQTGERLEHLRVRLAELPRGRARADADHAACRTRPHERSGHARVEARVGGMGRRPLDALVLGGAHAAAELERLARRAPSRGRAASRSPRRRARARRRSGGRRAPGRR